MRIAPISTYDVAAQQAWLQDMAARGEFLFEHKGWCATFYEDEPKCVRYRLQPVARWEKEPDTEQKEVYRELGWRYVCSTGRMFHIWRCDDPAIPELDTDLEMQAAGYDSVFHQLKIMNWATVIIFAIPVLLVVYLNWKWPDALTTLPVNWAPLWEVVIVWMTMAFSVSQLIYWNISLRRYVKKLKTGIPMPHRKPYQVSRVLSGLALTMYVVFVISRFVALFEPDSLPFEPVDSFDEPVPCVELPGLGEVEAIRWKNWRTSEQWRMYQGDWDGDNAESSYYRFYTVWDAERTALDLVDFYELLPVGDTQLDGAWWQNFEEYGYQRLVVWEERRVMEVTYGGPGDITKHLELYEELLQGE